MLTSRSGPGGGEPIEVRSLYRNNELIVGMHDRHRCSLLTSRQRPRQDFALNRLSGHKRTIDISAVVVVLRVVP